MRKSNIIDYKNPSQNLVTDVLSEFLRESAQKMLQLLCARYFSPPLRQKRSPLHTNFFAALCHPPF